MAFITKKHLPRRTFLQGMGVTLALPMLERCNRLLIRNLQAKNHPSDKQGKK